MKYKTYHVKLEFEHRVRARNEDEAVGLVEGALLTHSTMVSKRIGSTMCNSSVCEVKPKRVRT